MSECLFHARQHEASPDHWRVLRCAHLGRCSIVESGGSANHPDHPLDPASIWLTVPGDSRVASAPPFLREIVWEWMLGEMALAVRAGATNLDDFRARWRVFETALLADHAGRVRRWRRGAEMLRRVRYTAAMARKASER